jgi:hypothetical protein
MEWLSETRGFTSFGFNGRRRRGRLAEFDHSHCPVNSITAQLKEIIIPVYFKFARVIMAADKNSSPRGGCRGGCGPVFCWVRQPPRWSD